MTVGRLRAEAKMTAGALIVAGAVAELPAAAAVVALRVDTVYCTCSK